MSTPVVKSLGAALMHYFNQEPNAYKARAAELVEFKNSFSEKETIDARNELESYGYVFEKLPQ
jgi:hypothetical protein